MPDTSKPKTRSAASETREDRLKAALKANMAKRKAQARARAAKSDDDDGSSSGSAGPRS